MDRLSSSYQNLTLINCILKMIRQDSGEIRLDNKSAAFSVYSALSYEFFSHLF